MSCPNCAATLQMSTRQGVEIDYCPSCRGVWLDRGELDKIVERAAGSAGAPTYSEPPRGRTDRDDDWDDDRPVGARRRRRGWLGELFDFD